MTNLTVWALCPVFAVRLVTEWVTEGFTFLYADCKESDQTGWVPTLNCVLAGCKLEIVCFVTQQLR